MEYEQEERETDMEQAAWIAAEAKRIKRKRRHDLIYSIVFYAACAVAVAVFVLCVIGALR